MICSGFDHLHRAALHNSESQVKVIVYPQHIEQSAHGAPCQRHLKICEGKRCLLTPLRWRRQIAQETESVPKNRTFLTCTPTTLWKMETVSQRTTARHKLQYTRGRSYASMTRKHDSELSRKSSEAKLRAQELTGRLDCIIHLLVCAALTLSSFRLTVTTAVQHRGHRGHPVTGAEALGLVHGIRYRAVDTNGGGRLASIRVGLRRVGAECHDGLIGDGFLEGCTNFLEDLGVHAYSVNTRGKWALGTCQHTNHV